MTNRYIVMFRDGQSAQTFGDSLPTTFQKKRTGYILTFTSEDVSSAMQVIAEIMLDWGKNGLTGVIIELNRSMFDLPQMLSQETSKALRNQAKG